MEGFRWFFKNIIFEGDDVFIHMVRIFRLTVMSIFTVLISFFIIWIHL